MSLELQRYGRGPDGFPYILTALPDGYWTPWHLADQQIRRLETRVEELEAGQAVGEAEDLRREVDGLRDLLHRMLEAPTTQVSVTWKDAVRQALGNEPGQPAEPDEKCSPDGLRYKLPPLTMTGHQLRQALQFCNDDLDTELHVALRPGGTDTEGEKVEAGLCCWLAEYPEEGSILLDGRSLHDVPAAQADAQPAEPAPEQVSDSPFDQAIHQYAQAAWHHDMAGMRKGYMALQGLCSPSPAQADAQPVAPAAWLQPVCRYISDTLASGTPNERTVARTIMHMLPLDEALAAAPPARQPQWLPIDTAPKDGSLFLCWVYAVRYGETDEGQQYQQDASQVDFCSWREGPSDFPPGHGYFDPCCGEIGDSHDVTHWMPLPPPPGGIGREGE